MTDTKTHEQETSEQAEPYIDAPVPKFADSTAMKAGGTAADVFGRLSLGRSVYRGGTRTIQLRDNAYGYIWNKRPSTGSFGG
jgi:hypothetical protein